MAAHETLRPPELSVLEKPQDDRLIAKHSFKVITPILGGSAESRQVNTQRPIREPSIRGCLRFWWRATRGAQYHSDEELFKAEAALFGSTTEPSPFDVLVEITASGRTSPCATYSDSLTPRFSKDHPPYALFPFQGETKGRKVVRPPDHGLYGVSFTLTLVAKKRTDLSELRRELCAALWAWSTFGGYGSRTRRGCGSLSCDGFLPADAASLRAMAKKRLAEAQGGVSCAVLQGARVVIGGPVDDSLWAWRQAVEAYRQLRQGDGLGRNPRPKPSASVKADKRPGRSRWPEPDAIRRAAGRHAPSHCPVLPDGFPRADLGLPIVFHFKDPGDPGDSVLQLGKEGRTRMASPVITKAMALANGQFAPMVAVLKAPRVWDLGTVVLTGARHSITDAELKATAQPVTDLSAADVRDAVIRQAERALKAEAVTLP